MHAGIFTYRFTSCFNVVWKGMSTICLLFLLLSVSWVTAAEMLTLECEGKIVRIVVPKIGGAPVTSLFRQDGKAAFGAFIDEKPVSIILVAERMNSKWSDPDNTDAPNTYVGFSRFKDALMDGIRVKGTRGSARLEYEEPFGIVNSDKEPKARHRGIVGGMILCDDSVVSCLLTLDRATEAESREMVESTIRWVKDMNEFGAFPELAARMNANGVEIVIPPPKGFERLHAGSATVEKLDNVSMESFEFTSFSAPRRPSPEEGKVVFVARFLKSESFDAHPETLYPLMLDIMEMKGHVDQGSDARYGAMFRMTPPEGGMRIFRPLSLKSRLVVVGLQAHPAIGGETADFDSEFDAWCEAILRANGEAEREVNPRVEAVSPAAD